MCREKATEAKRQANRDRAARWYEQNREHHIRRVVESRRANAKDCWTDAPPNCGTHLPGAVLTVAIDRDGDRSTIAHRHVRALHGVVAALLDRGHDANVPDFSLLASGASWSPSGWALYLRDPDDARALAGKTIDVCYQDGPALLTFGTMTRLRTPSVSATGRHRVRIEAITPVHIRRAAPGARRDTYSRPTTHALWSALTHALPMRLGIEIDPRRIAIEVVAHQTEETGVVLGKINGGGAVRGWTGSVVLDVSPAARWLLECAARIGLGGRTAFGFGRIALREVAAEEPVEGTAPDPHEERVSDHAATQAAHVLGTTIESARAQVVAASAHASFVERFADGTELWQAGDVRFIVASLACGAIRIMSVAFGEQPMRRGAPGALHVTDYAVRRFRSRIRPDLDIAAARARLEELVAAGRCRGPYNGRVLRESLVRPELWRGPRAGATRDALADSRIRFIVSHGPGELPQVVTVLPRRPRAQPEERGQTAK